MEEKREDQLHRYDAATVLKSLGFIEKPDLPGSYSSEEPLELDVIAQGGKVTEFESSAPTARHTIKPFTGGRIQATGADIIGNDITIYSGGNVRYGFELASVANIGKFQPKKA